MKGCGKYIWGFNMEEILRIDKLTAGYKKKIVLNDISFSLKQSEKMLLIGPNGSGKSTLIKAILGLAKIAEGEIYFKREKIKNLPTYKIINKGIGYLAQTKNIFPSLTVYENIKIAFWNRKEKELEERLEEILKVFPFLKDFLQKRAGLLSGGERQALAISLVLFQDKNLYLIDEPTAGLSPKSAENILAGIKKISENNSNSFILIEHNLKFVQDWYNRLLIMKEGKLVKEEEIKGLELKEVMEKVYFQ